MADLDIPMPAPKPQSTSVYWTLAPGIGWWRYTLVIAQPSKAKLPSAQYCSGPNIPQNTFAWTQLMRVLPRVQWPLAHSRYSHKQYYNFSDLAKPPHSMFIVTGTSSSRHKALACSCAAGGWAIIDRCQPFVSSSPRAVHVNKLYTVHD